MFFTQEDYRKIEKWLLANSRKDTDFVGAATPLKGNETVVLVQNGKNVKTSVKDIVDQFFLLGVSDFLNITDKYGESYISLTQAIQLIPFRSRKEGQVITFIDESGNWAIYQFQGKALNQWNNPTLWIDLLAKVSGIPIIDSEDITTKENSAKQVSLYLADKQYNEADYSGLGRIYLRKNIYTVVDPSTRAVINVNLLTQSMLAKENTTYIIQYDYNLNKQTISIPEGSVLLFEGGSIDNGAINCNGTTIVDKFSGNATIVGTYSFQDAQADEEDITQNQSSVLKFKDRKYEPDKYSGLGRVILRKNIVEIDDPIYGKVTKNILFQNMIAQANTIYEIRYDYNLNGNTVTIPEGCILDMRGGSVTNGTINCVDTIIISTDASKLDVTLTGTYRFDSEKLVTSNTEDINISQSVDRKSHTISAMLADRDTTNGMGYVILRKDKSFKEQVTQENTIYEIRYDFDLNNQTIYIPTECQFDYVGGSLSNGKVVYNNTLISGNEIIESITREGNYNYLNSIADNEDLVSVDGKLSLKDRSTLNGMGYVILRKDKTFAEQITQENTIYEIRYDFDLNGEEITIPEGCTLDFKGGSFNNGTIIGNNTSINTTSNKVIDNIKGTWSIDSFDPCWFGLDYSSSDNSSVLNKILSSLPEYAILKFNKSKICNCTSNVAVKKKGIKIIDANIKGPNPATFDIYANNITFDNCYFSNCSQVIRLFTCENIQILNCYFKSCSYSIIQQLGYASNNVLVDGCICENAVADFVEANCTKNAPSKNWTIVNNQFLGSVSYPNTKTEERFVGITAVTNVVISNNIVENVAGDAAVHLEDTGSTVIISNNVFNKISGTGCIYTMHSAYDVLVEGNIFKATDNKSYTVWYEGDTSSKKIFNNNVVIGNVIPIYWSNTAHNIIKGNLFRGTQGINLEAVFDIEISNNTFVGMKSPIGTQRGGEWRGDPKFVIIGNNFKDTSASLCIDCPRNTNSGTGHTKSGMVINNIFDKGISGNANNSNLEDTGKVFIGNNVLLSGSISFSGAETANNKVYS